MLPEPITNKEKYLAKAAGLDIALPEPVTREEFYLNEIAKNSSGSGGNGTVDSYTKSQTDTLLSKKVDKVEGKQLSTEDYTTAEKEKLKSIDLTWHTIQSTVITKALDDTDSVILDDLNANEHVILSACAPNTIVSAFCTDDGKWGIRFMPISGAIGKEEITVTIYYLDMTSELEGAPPLTFRTSGTHLADYRIYGNTDGLGDYDSGTEKYKISVNISGKNLFSLTKDNFLNGTAVSNATMVTMKRLIPNTQYTLSTNAPVYNSASGVPNIWFGNTQIFVSDGIPQTYTADETGSINIYIRTNMIDRIFSGYWIQLELGNTATEYEPYHEKITTVIPVDQPLQAGESISLSETGVQIPTFSGQNTLSVDTEIPPEKVYIRYRKSETKTKSAGISNIADNKAYAEEMHPDIIQEADDIDSEFLRKDEAT